MGISDWGTVSAVVAALLAECADRVLGLDLGDHELYLHRQRASFWCFYVSFYAAFVLVYASMVSDDPNAELSDWRRKGHTSALTT